MKKKIVFMVINMNIGGTEKALLNMINELPNSEYDITILMLEHYGGFLDSIPIEVNVIYLKEYTELKDALEKPPKTVALNLLRSGNMIIGLSFYTIYLISRVTKNKSLLFRYLLQNVPILTTEYDIAVAYAGPMDFISYFVANKIKAKKYIQWIHFDVTKIGFNKSYASLIYNEFDHIFVVSAEGRTKLVSQLPTLQKKIDTFLNIVSPKLIRQLSNEGEGFEDNFQGIRILTVGRLSKEKGQDLAISVLSKLKDNGFNVRWYCIGDGNARSEYQNLIKKYGIENDFILLGAITNPYPYMKQCDIYVQPSRHEGYCITLSEARCFSNPIISVNFAGAFEQIDHNNTGLIINFSSTQLYNALTLLMNNETLRLKIKRNLEKEIINTAEEIEKLNVIFDLVWEL
ncbi:glycosyltransferase [Aquibacillus halophilus]|uniref:Glycosyltransferase n=1 Tax=Aquibacillus halophilus TaxID=930132 RepID=A0A6A8DB15_9BACI|nr:glycosyltransferase [Aquibacillus halophilus]MRH42704.1 glycosyltransferase [Aquibacillus halophilus]